MLVRRRKITDVARSSILYAKTEVLLKITERKIKKNIFTFSSKVLSENMRLKVATFDG